MKINTRLAVICASLLAIGGTGLTAAVTYALPAGAQTPAPAVSTPNPGPAATSPAPAPSSTADSKGAETPETPGAPDTDNVQDQSGDQAGDQSGPNDTTGPDTPEAGGVHAPEAPGATGAAA
jgi:hypothetical protein